MTSFRAFALESDVFSTLVDLGDDELAAKGAKRYVADECPGFPCRVSLQDAAIGEEVILGNFQHLSGSAHAAFGPIFVRKGATRAEPKSGEIPEVLLSRLLSVRAYDAYGLMVDAEVCEGTELRSILERFFGNENVVQVHVHFARPGCYACKFEREL